MQTFSFSLTNARLTFLLDITRNDETVIHACGATYSVSIDDTSSPPVTTTWTPVAGLKIGDVTNSNDGTLPTFSFDVRAESGGVFDPFDIDNDLFQGALVELYITDAANPVSKDFQFKGKISQVDYDLIGNVTFEVISIYAIQRDAFIRQYGIPDDCDFGDPRRSKIPTFPDVTAGSSDLHDVARLETIAVGDRRRFRFAAGGTPDDYANVYLEATAISTGITGSSAPTPSSTVGSTYVDAGVTWTTRNAWARYAQVGTIYDSRNFLLSNYVEPLAVDNTWLTPGRLIVRTGYGKNMVAKIRTWDSTSGQIELVQPIALLLSVGDWLEVAPDSDKTLDRHVEQHGNAYDYRGYAHLTGSKVVTSQIIVGVTEFPGPTDDPGSGALGGYEPFAVEFAEGSS